MPGLVEPGARGNVVALAVFNAFRGYTVGGFMALLPMYMRSLGYGMDSIGGVVAASSVGLSLLLPAIGYLIDTAGARVMVLATGALAAVAPLIASSTASLAGLGAAYAVFLFSFLAGQPARMAFLASTVGPARMGWAVGVTSSVFSASRTAGPAAAGVLAATLGYAPAFLSLAASAAAGLAAFAALSRPVPPAARPGDGGGWLGAYRRLLRPGRRLALVFGYVSLDRVSWSLWFPMLSAHLYSQGYTEDLVGYAITAGGLVQSLLLPKAGRLADTHGPPVVLAASEALGVAAALLYASPHPYPRVLAAATLMGASIALWVPGYNALIARAAGGSGEAYTAANTVRSLAGAPAPYAGGLLYESISPAAPFALSGLLLLLAAAYASRLLPKAIPGQLERRASPRGAPAGEGGAGTPLGPPA